MTDLTELANVDVHDFTKVYNFCFGGGGIYTPTDRDKAMIEDAINSYIAECEQAAPRPPKSLHWLGDRDDADQTRHAVDTTGCVLYFDSEGDCLQFMRRLTGRAK